jgi:hypothetical protein
VTLFSAAVGSIPTGMDRSNPEAHTEGTRPPLTTLMMAAIVPFAVIGLLALPLAFNFLKQFVGS